MVENPFAEALNKEPASSDVRLVYADWLEERGEDGEAERQRDFAELLKITALVRTRVEEARMAGKSEEFIEGWLRVWKLHNGVDSDWDYAWLWWLRRR